MPTSLLILCPVLLCPQQGQQHRDGHRDSLGSERRPPGWLRPDLQEPRYPGRQEPQAAAEAGLREQFHWEPTAVCLSRST